MKPGRPAFQPGVLQERAVPLGSFVQRGAWGWVCSCSFGFLYLLHCNGYSLCGSAWARSSECSISSPPFPMRPFNRTQSSRALTSFSLVCEQDGGTQVPPPLALHAHLAQGHLCPKELADGLQSKTERGPGTSERAGAEDWRFNHCPVLPVNALSRG